jgi:hypothetical protein
VDSQGLLVQLAKIHKLVISGDLHDAHFLPRAGGGRLVVSPSEEVGELTLSRQVLSFMASANDKESAPVHTLLDEDASLNLENHIAE